MRQGNPGKEYWITRSGNLKVIFDRAITILLLCRRGSLMKSNWYMRIGGLASGHLLLPVSEYLGFFMDMLSFNQ
jgi:hypothetical protein